VLKLELERQTNMDETQIPSRPNVGFTQGPERIGEGNWEWYKAGGFRPYRTLSQEEVERLAHVPLNRQPDFLLNDKFGDGNVHRGDVYDPANERPLRHIPGMTIYVRGSGAQPEGELGTQK
jgi:hypothetical protein